MRALEVSVGLVIRQRFDYHVSFRSEARSSGKVFYNYAMSEFPSEKGSDIISGFAKGLECEVFHTCSTYGRGLDILNGTYHLLDLVPKSHDGDGVASSMA
jgi:predicted dithiol-disulfide oxidoreductase (DUF899 family)